MDIYTEIDIGKNGLPCLLYISNPLIMFMRCTLHQTAETMTVNNATSLHKSSLLKLASNFVRKWSNDFWKNDVSTSDILYQLFKCQDYKKFFFFSMTLLTVVPGKPFKPNRTFEGKARS